MVSRRESMLKCGQSLTAFGSITSESTENPQENRQSQTESADRPIFRVVGASPTGVIGRLFQLPADMTVGAFRTAAVRAGEYIFAGERSLHSRVGAQLDLMKETGAHSSAIHARLPD